MSTIINKNNGLDFLNSYSSNSPSSGKCFNINCELHNWNDFIRSGLISLNSRAQNVADNVSYTSTRDNHFGKSTDFLLTAESIRASSSNKLHDKHPDVLIIGGGVIGCAVARELKRYALDIILVEKEHDISLHLSKNKDTMISYEPDRRAGRIVKNFFNKGVQIYPAICNELNVPFRHTGQYFYFTNVLMKPAALALTAYWKMTGINAQYVSRKKLKNINPLIDSSIKFALFIRRTGYICPDTLTNAYAQNAKENGAQIYFDTSVSNIVVFKEIIQSVFTNHGRIYPKLVINAAGVSAGEIALLANDRNSGINDNNFILSFGKNTKNIIHASGVRSSELSVVPAVAQEVSRMAADFLNAGINDHYNPLRKATA